MASSALSLQWGLDATATGTLAVAKGLVMAATTDNVSILALLACERFGGTLPASSMSIQKLASALIPRSPAHIAFLKATVGFLHNDCAMQLGTSAAGVRFLVFAAALIPTAGVFQSAVTLDKMLRDSASDLRDIPPPQGLRHLLKVLEPRVPACGFNDTVLFCQKLVEEQIVPQILSTYLCGISNQEVQSLKGLMLYGVPAADTLSEIVNAFRQIGRLGPATVTALTIRTGTGIPWVLAFTQWCLDVPISLSIGDLDVLAPANAKVHILVPGDVKDLRKHIKITTHHKLERLDSLIQPSMQDTITVPPAIHIPANRLVTMGAYREHLLRRLGFDKCSPEMLREAIEYSTPVLLSYSLQPYRISFDEGPEHPSRIEPDRNRLRPFPGVHVISRVAEKLLSFTEPISFKKLDEGQLIATLPHVSHHLAQLNQVRCHECNVTNGSIDYDELWHIGCCSRSHFFRSLAMLTCEILAISVFQDVETIFIRPPNYQTTIFSRLQFDVRELLECPQEAHSRTPFHDHSLVRLAKYLVGHDDGTEKPTEDLISSRQGQVVYHSIFDTFRVEKYGYAELICLPGVLRYNGEIFNSLAKGERISNGRVPGRTQPTFLQERDPLIPPNFEDTSISWRISLSGETALQATLLLTSMPDGILKDADPNALLSRLGSASILETCAHSQDTPVEMNEEGVLDTPVWRPIYRVRDSTAIHVVRVGRAADQLCFALASIERELEMGEPFVIGRGACFGCCVNLCRFLEAQVLFFGKS